MRISRQVMFMEVAKVFAKRSTCFRLNVGAVVTVDNRAVSHGWNGQPPGAAHCSGNTCPGADGCKETIHAEDNALRYVPQSVQLLPKDLYVTDSPCLDCAHKIIKARVQRVFFATPYRDTAPLQLLHVNGIEVYQVMPSGYVIDWKTRRIVEID